MIFVDGPPHAQPETDAPASVRVPMSERLERWIGYFCRDGKGDPVTLTTEQQLLLKLLYDGPPPVMIVVGGALAPYLALAVICGPIMADTRSSFEVGDERMWAAASPELQAALERDEHGRILYSSRWPILTT
jgi:hypothetical protein